MTSEHPADREMLPDDPMELKAIAVPGDVDVMFRLLVEEYSRMSYDAEAILQLARNPFYDGFHRFYLALGEEGMRGRVEAVLRRCGVVSVSHGRDADKGGDEERNTPCRK